MRGSGWIAGLVVLVAVAGSLAAWRYLTPPPVVPKEPKPIAGETQPGTQTATFGGGCFWCTEAVFLQLDGVKSVVSGFSGGTVKNPTYEQVCKGGTGHAECVQIVFDPAVITYEELLDIFFQTHDPTTLNRQGNDVGPHYRSVIFTHSDEQKQQAEQFAAKLTREGAYASPLVTQIVAFDAFYPAEDYHQDYFAKNPAQPYCRAFIPPKLDKVEKNFKGKMKK